MRLFTYKIHNINVFMLAGITLLLIFIGLSSSIDNWFSDWSGYDLPKSLFWKINVIIRWIGFPIMVITLIPLWMPRVRAGYVLIGLVVYFFVLTSFFPSYGFVVSAILTIIVGVIFAFLYVKML